MEQLLGRYDILAPLVLAFVAALVGTPLVILIARATGAVDRPRNDRFHERATPLLGGVALTGGIVAAILAFGDGSPELYAVAGGALLLHVVGLVDDLWGVRPAMKLVAQTAAAGILISGGVGAGWPEEPLLSVPLTIIWVVGITNALNLLDNMDGLAAGIAGISAAAIATCSAVLPAPVGEASVLVALAVAGTAFGFLPFNVNPARVFMGDAGSLPLGFCLAAAALLATHREAGQLAIVLAAPLLTLAVPILDTTLVSVLRSFHGRAISQGGRDHLSHRLVALGVPVRRAVGTLWLTAAIFGAFAVASTRMPQLGSLLLLAIALIVSIVLGVVLGRVKVYAPTQDVASAERTEELRRTFANYLRVLGPMSVDFVLIGAAYVGAYLLRFDGEVPSADREFLVRSIAIVVAVQLAALAGCRVYRNVWRYFGVADSWALARGVALAGAGSFIAVVFLWREEAFSRGVFLLDIVLVTVLLFGARGLARFFSEAFGRFPDDGVRVLVVGAGDAGTLCLRALRTRGGRGATPIGLLDDDPTLRRRQIHGVRVLGGTADLERVLDELRPEEVVLSTLPGDEPLDEYRRIAQAAGVRLSLSPYARAFVPL